MDRWYIAYMTNSLSTKDRNIMMEAAIGYSYLRGKEDGEAARLDGVAVPNLSGEFAGDLLPAELVHDVWNLDEETPEEADAICTAYEDGVSATYYA